MQLGRHRSRLKFKLQKLHSKKCQAQTHIENGMNGQGLNGNGLVKAPLRNNWYFRP